jgi:hypothetical protein
MESIDSLLVTAIWLAVKEDFGANPIEDPKRATRQRTRKDFMALFIVEMEIL